MVDKSDFDKAILELRTELSDEQIEDALLEAAFFVEGQAKQNIVANDQIDTAFMLNSVYSVSRSGGGSFGQTRSSGRYKGREDKSSRGQSVERSRLPTYKIIGSNPAAAVVAGAEYAIYQETDHRAFLRPAFDDNIDQITRVLQERLSDD